MSRKRSLECFICNKYVFFSNVCLFVSKLFLSIKNTNTSKTKGFQVIYYCCRLGLRIFMLQKKKKKGGKEKYCFFFFLTPNPLI